MELSEFYPLPRDFIRNELEVLDYLGNSTYIGAEHPQFWGDAKKYRAQYRGPRSGFQFASFLNVFHAEMPRLRKRTARHLEDEPNLKLIVASLIEQQTKSKYGNISYLLAVGRIRSLTKEPGPKTYPSLLRKFHFDVTAGTANEQTRRQEHPMCHLQYCGGFIPLMAELGFRQSQLEQMHERLSEPRIFFWPMSLALLVDMALHEFPDPKSAQFRKEPEWRNIIRKNEAFLLRPFHEKCVAIIRNVAKQRRTLADEFYVA
jgi:hypothetical protein